MSRVLQLNDILMKDQLGCFIANTYQEWDNYRANKKADWRELYKYIYATDTRTTSNSVLPWKNTTTTPKLTQIRDNLYANYMASMFPKRRWVAWEGATEDDETKAKTDAIKAYMGYIIDYQGFKDTVSRLVLDYIDNGNTFVTVDWLDERVETETGIKAGYVGPVARRISPVDIVMNPTAPDFSRAPKIVRTLVSLGELQEYMQRLSTDDGEREASAVLFDYLNEVRLRCSTFEGDISTKDEFFSVDGFTSFRAYLTSGYAEILTFYGDLYDTETATFLKNHIVQVVDRHKVIRKEPNPSDSGIPPIFHSGWRLRQDNLWAMGPLDNLVGMQYRLDHLENAKADFIDLINFPPLKIKGYVEDFKWAPFEKIYVGDEGDVEVLTSSTNPLTINLELDHLQAKMEELAGSPKEAMGFRTPGEKTAFEVQTLQNASGRIFQSKITQFEEQIIEPLLNAMLELARRKMDATTVRVIDDEFKVATFMSLTADDIMGAGRIRPVAARHFAEVAERVQNVTQLYQTLGADQLVLQHFSSIEMAKFFEELLDLEQYHLVQPFIRLTEQAEGQQLQNQHDEDTAMAAGTPAGISPDDYDTGQPGIPPAPTGTQ
jgi:hypothetical protein